MAVMDYRTQDGLTDYGFSIEFQSDVGWRVYIIFRGHDDSLSLPHQAIDHQAIDHQAIDHQAIDYNGRCYVNWPAKIDSLGDAKTVAALWAELIQRYQRAEKQRRDSNEKPKRIWSVEQMEEDAA